MPRYTLSTLLAIAAASTSVLAQDGLVPLADKRFDWTNLVRDVVNAADFFLTWFSFVALSGRH